MKPIDYRNETWEQVRARVDESRLAVYRALETAGACTIRQLAERSGIDLLNVRPRVTELYQLGFVELANGESRAGEGVYQAVPMVVVMHRFHTRKTAETSPQLSLL